MITGIMSTKRKERSESRFRVFFDDHGLSSSKTASIVQELTSVASVELVWWFQVSEWCSDNTWSTPWRKTSFLVSSFQVGRRDANYIVSSRPSGSRRDPASTVRLLPDQAGMLAQLAALNPTRLPEEEYDVERVWGHPALPSRADVVKGLSKVLTEVKLAGIPPLPRAPGTTIPRHGLLHDFMEEGPISFFPEVKILSMSAETRTDHLRMADVCLSRALMCSQRRSLARTRSPKTS